MCMVTLHGAVKMTATGTNFWRGWPARTTVTAVDSTAKGLVQYVSNKQLSTGIAKGAFLGYSTGPPITAALITALTDLTPGLKFLSSTLWFWRSASKPVN